MLELLTEATGLDEDDYFSVERQQSMITASGRSKTKPTVHIIRRPSPSLPGWFAELAGRTISLTELPEGWDSFDAAPISLQTVTSALTLLALSSTPEVPMPDVVPTVSGGIAFEWSLKKHSLEIEVSEGGEVTLFFEDFEADEEYPVEQVTIGIAKGFVAQLAG